jgi:hypothetical protein
MTEDVYSTKRLNGIPLRESIYKAKGDKMLTGSIRLLRTDFERTRSSRSPRRGRFQQLREYAKLDWVPWTQDGPTDSLVPSDESMSAAAEAARTAYSIMHLTKDQLIKIHDDAGFDGFEETMANLANTEEMLKAIVRMIEGARGRMIVSACACLQKRKPQNFAYRHGMDLQIRRKPLR